MFILIRSTSASKTIVVGTRPQDRPIGTILSLHSTRASALRAWAGIALPVVRKGVRIFNRARPEEKEIQQRYKDLQIHLCREQYEQAFERYHASIGSIEIAFYYIVEMPVTA